MISEIELGPNINRVIGRFLPDERALVSADRGGLINQIIRLSEECNSESPLRHLDAAHYGIRYKQALSHILDMNDIDPTSVGYMLESLTHPMGDNIKLTLEIADVGVPAWATSAKNRLIESPAAMEREEKYRGRVLEVKISDEKTSHSFFVDFSSVSVNRKFIDLYLGVLTEQHDMGVKASFNTLGALKAFEESRCRVHLDSAKLVSNGFLRAGFFVGPDLAKALFFLVAHGWPEKSNPIPQMVVDARSSYRQPVKP
ncbi:MAG: hypothetical protein GC136_04065 [Alphaproteobacteria bacterium]|nr:hypothetical protein [Alphaproteobacteria bacterium]